MFCTKCGNKVADNLERCPHCGNVLVDVERTTRIGITAGFLGAGLYFMGMLNTLGMLLIAGYILILENDTWLKRAALKAIGVSLLFCTVRVLASCIVDVSGVFQSLLGIFKVYINLSTVNGFNQFVSDLCNVLQNLIFFMLGIKAFSKGTVKVPIVDGMIQKYYKK